MSECASAIVIGQKNGDSGIGKTFGEEVIDGNLCSSGSRVNAEDGRIFRGHCCCSFAAVRSDMM
jgi:hypothetical protein